MERNTAEAKLADALDPRVLEARDLHQAGRLAEAEPLYRAALADRPDDAEALRLLAYVELNSGRAAEGAARLGRAAALRPTRFEAQMEWADALLEASEFDAAAEAFAAALALRPGFPDALRGQGVALSRAQRHDAAIEAFRKAVAAQPGDAGYLYDLAQALRGADRREEALEPMAAVVRAAPDFAPAQFHLAGLLLALGRPDESLVAARRAVALDPAGLETQLQLSASAYAAWSLEEAAMAATRALRLAPDEPSGHLNLGLAFYQLGRLEEAEPHLRRAVALAPDSADSHYGLGDLLLKLGRFEEGWAEYEWRSRSPDAPPRPLDDGTPPWRGEPLAGKTLRIEEEQGAGDLLQFVRLARGAAERGAHVVVQANPSFLTLLASVPGVDEAVSVEAVAPADYACSVMSLPHRLGLTVETIPAEVPYLTCPPEEVARWAERIGTHGFRVGVSWRGNLRARGGRARAFPLAALEPLSRVPGVRLISLQKATDGDMVVEMPKGMALEALGDEFHIDDWTTTAAAAMNLDLVISCDTGLGHLAGALGLPVWLAQPHVTEWRWLTDRDDSPWYPRHRLFRQPRPGDWTSVVKAMERELRGLVEQA